MDEHRWRFKVGSKRYDQYRAVERPGEPAVVEVFTCGRWGFWVGQSVADEMLWLAAENEELRARLAHVEAKTEKICSTRNALAYRVDELEELVRRLKDEVPVEEWLEVE